MMGSAPEQDLNTQIQYRLIEKLSESEKRYRDLVENLREIVFKCDHSGKILFLNQAWTNTLGYPTSESLSMPLGNFVAADDLDQFANLLVNLEVDQRADQLLRFRHQSDRILYLELYAQKNSQQEISGSMVDVTAREEANHFLSQAKERLEVRVAERTAALAQTNQELTETLQNLESLQGQLIQAEKMSSMGQLVAGIAHEINNPINFIHGNLFYAHQHTEALSNFVEAIKAQFQTNTQVQTELETLEVDFILDDLPAIFKSMRNGADRITDIVASLQNFARLNETGIKKVDIHKGLESTLLILQHRFKNESGHKFIEIIQDYSELPLIACDAGQLNQVFMNVLTNAIDALEESRRQQAKSDVAKTFQLRLTTTVVDAEQIEIAIADNGPGIPKTVQPKIFDPFFTTKSVGKGTGMGLAISHQIITENHGGILEVHSTPGQGTEVKIRLPIRQGR